jgi:uncharacterized protein
MPAALTYPGVYIEEIKSGVRTITGVATSIAAFVGRAPRGPSDDPVTINSFGDFQRAFGGLVLDHPLGFAVRDFFLNGGSQAIVVRVLGSTAPAAGPAPPASGPPLAPTAAAKAQIKLVAVPSPAPPTGGSAAAPADLLLEASSEGTWGNSLVAIVDYATKEKLATGKKDSDRTLFNLTVSEQGDSGQAVQTERFLNVAFDDASPRYLPRVLKQESNLVRVKRNASGTDWVTFALPAVLDAKGKPLPAATADGGLDGESTLREADLTGDELGKKGIFALENADLFNMLCIPEYTSDDLENSTLVGAAAAYCERRRAVLLVDPPSAWNSAASALKAFTADPGVGTRSSNAALFFPRLRQPNPLRENQVEDSVPCGAVAGVFARTDSTRGVWKAPAGVDATLVGVPQLSVSLTDAENGQLNPVAINCLRTFPVYGRIVWGSRTLAGADILSDDYKYIPVRRLALFIEESLFRGTKWVVFEPNDEPLWAQIRLNIGAFMHTLFRQGAFQGTTPRDAYFVKCDKETTIQTDINLGIVNIVVGFAPLKPAEFVVIKLQQIAGQIDV